jgi:hypothetical protein
MTLVLLGQLTYFNLLIAFLIRAGCGFYNAPANYISAIPDPLKGDIG